jgi:peptide/nickel transport system permease protein
MEYNVIEQLQGKYTQKITDQPYFRQLYSSLKKIFSDKSIWIYTVFLILLLITAVFGPFIAPYDPAAPMYTESGEIKQLASPSMEHPLGTTVRGNDVFSRLLVGVGPTVLVGLIGGTMIAGIGLAVGVTAGYVGGTVGNILMRVTDFVYSVPVIPSAVVIISILGIGFYSSIFVLGLLLWRSSARVIRSQVLQIKNYPFIEATKATGASDTRIIVENILPNIAPMAIFFFAWGIGYTILVQSSLAFLGITDPFVPSWGIMIRNVYDTGYIAEAWWWSIPPGLLISFTVLSTFMIGRKFEDLSNEGDNSGGVAV